MARRLGNPKWLAVKEMKGGEGFLKFGRKKKFRKRNHLKKYTETN